MVVPALAVVFVAGMAWVQYRDGGGSFGSASDGGGRPDNYPPAGEAASADPLGVPPPLAEPAGAFEFSHTQREGDEPVAFDPCRPIRYVVNPAGAPPGGGELIRAAVERITAGTGLVFIDDGLSDERWSKEREPYQPDRYGDRWAPVLISWSTEDEVPGLGGFIAGLGGGIARSDPDGRLGYVSGGAVIDRDDAERILAGPEGTEQVRVVIQHELGHVLGLGHVADETQVMNAAGSAVLDWGTGDLAGLHHLGSGPCLPDL